VNRFRSRIIKAGFWSIGGHGFGQVLRLVSNLIMTRLLAPEMFGVMAIANVLMVGFSLFSDLGLRQNIVQSKRGDDPVFLNTVWSVQIVRGIIIWFTAVSVSGVLYFAGQVGLLSVDTVYGNPILPFVIAIIAFSSIISGFESTRLSTATRRLVQKKVVLMEVSSQLVGFVVTISWAVVDRNIWALVAGNLAGSLAKTVFSYTMLPGMSNRWKWDSVVIREVLHFGKWVFLSSIFGFLLNSGDRLLLGGLINADVLGVYSIAFLMINAIQMAVSKFSGVVVFPALSEVFRDRVHRLKGTYYKFRLWQDAGILFLAGFLMSAGSVIISLLYDDRYAGAGPMMQILSLVLVAQRYALADQCYLAMGRPNLMTMLIIIRILALYSFIPLGFYLNGIEGAVWGIVLGHFASVPASMYLKAKYNIFDLKAELIILPAFLPGMVLGNLLSIMYPVISTVHNGSS